MWFKERSAQGGSRTGQEGAGSGWFDTASSFSPIPQGSLEHEIEAQFAPNSSYWLWGVSGYGVGEVTSQHPPQGSMVPSGQEIFQSRVKVWGVSSLNTMAKVRVHMSSKGIWVGHCHLLDGMEGLLQKD